MPKCRNQKTVRCVRCKREKPVSCFYGPYRSEYGVYWLAYCRACQKKYASAYYRTHKKAHKVASREYRRMKRIQEVEKAEMVAFRKTAEVSRARIDAAAAGNFHAD